MSKTNVSNSASVANAVQADWDNRQFSNSLSLNVRRLFEFLLQFGEPRSPLSCPGLLPEPYPMLRCDHS